jgi:hypothetical protein
VDVVVLVKTLVHGSDGLHAGRRAVQGIGRLAFHQRRLQMKDARDDLQAVLDAVVDLLSSISCCRARRSSSRLARSSSRRSFRSRNSSSSAKSRTPMSHRAASGSSSSSWPFLVQPMAGRRPRAQARMEQGQ